MSNQALIEAKTESGNGGNIQITTQGIFGLKYRPQLTFENDITASSEFGVNGKIDLIADQPAHLQPSLTCAVVPN